MSLNSLSPAATAKTARQPKGERTARPSIGA
jgi:hypothetical protein